MSAVVAVGLDLCPVDRIRRAVERHGDRFVQRIMTEREAAYCFERRLPWECLAARFAVKEAASKALGAPRGIGWHDVEVLPARSGEHGPSVVMTGRALEVAQERGIRSILISITHAGGMAAAVAVAVT
ncbi:MAG: holo-ACP synthase [Myxococcales bacterium]|nr:holo-ACP synthase [Myxococcales bacterium]